MRNPKKPGVVGFMKHSMKLSRNLAIPGDVVVGRAGTHTQWEIHGNPEDCHRSIKREAEKMWESHWHKPTIWMHLGYTTHLW